MLSDLPDCWLPLTKEGPAGARAWLCSCGINSPTAAGYHQRGDKPVAAGRSIFQYTLEGTGHLQFRGVSHHLHPGQAMLLQPPDEYAYGARDGVRWRFFWLTLDGEDAARYWHEMLQRVGPVLTVAPEGPVVTVATRLLLERFHSAEPVPAWADAQGAYELCLAILREIEEMRQGSPSPQVTAVRRVQYHIQRNLATDLSVDLLARIAGLSRAHFSRVFRQHSGLSPGDYVLQQRLDQARHLLVTTQRPIYAIAAAAGFSDPNYFARIFRQRLGTTPVMYRDRGHLSSNRT